MASPIDFVVAASAKKRAANQTKLERFVEAEKTKHAAPVTTKLAYRQSDKTDTDTGSKAGEYLPSPAIRKALRMFCVSEATDRARSTTDVQNSPSWI